MGVKRTIVRNVFSQWTGFFVGAVIAFFMMPFLINRLGDSTYGIWIIIGSLIGYFGLFDLGLRASIGRYLAHYRAKSDTESMNSTGSTAFFLLLALAVVIVLSVSGLSVFFAKLVKAPPEQANYVRLTLIVVGATLSVRFVSAMFESVLWANQRFDLINATEVGSKLLQAGLTVWVVLSGGRLLALALTGLGVYSVCVIAQAWLAYREIPELRFRLKFFSPKRLKELYGYGVWSFLLHISDRVIASTDKVLIAAIPALGPAMVTIYSAAGRLFEYTSAFISSGTAALGPLAVHIDATNDRKREQDLLVTGTRLTFSTALFFLVFFAVSGKTFMCLWLGPRFEISATILVILLAGTSLRSAQGPAFSIILAKAKHRPLALVFCIRSIVMIALMFALGKAYGLIGVAAGIAVPELLFLGLFCPPYVSRLTGTSLGKLVLLGYLPAIIPAATAGGLFWALESFVTYKHLWQIGFGFAAGGFVFSGTLFLTCLSREQRRSWLKPLFRISPQNTPVTGG